MKQEIVLSFTFVDIFWLRSLNGTCKKYRSLHTKKKTKINIDDRTLSCFMVDKWHLIFLKSNAFLPRTFMRALS